MAYVFFKIASATESCEVTGKEIRMVNSGVTRSCTLDIKPIYAVASYDRSAVIVSERGCVKKDDLDNCQPGISVRLHFIPGHIEFLLDINLQKIYTLYSILLILGHLSIWQPLHMLVLRRTL